MVYGSSWVQIIYGWVNGSSYFFGMIRFINWVLLVLITFILGHNCIWLGGFVSSSMRRTNPRGHETRAVCP